MRVALELYHKRKGRCKEKSSIEREKNGSETWEVYQASAF